MDIVGRFYLVDGTELKVVTGIDDHIAIACVHAPSHEQPQSRCVTRSSFALRTHGAPDQILSDNGKVFTSRFGQGPGPVLFDRICQNNGIRHLLTAPYSPTTTGKVERFHKTIGLSSSSSTTADTRRSTKHKRHSIPGWSITTRSGHINRSGIDRPSNGFALWLFVKPWTPRRSRRTTRRRHDHDRRASVGGLISKGRSLSTV